MKENFGKVRRNWNQMTARQMQELSEVMFDAAKVPKAVRIKVSIMIRRLS